ncbi:glutathione S-transferase family protein [Acidisoma sp. 7E03]
MGYAEDGVWHTGWYDTKSHGGRFQRTVTRFRNWVTPDGSPGPSGEGGFPAEAGRYRLYVSLACPWAHRTLIFRALKGLEEMIPVSVVNWVMRERGWTFDPAPGVVADPEGAATLFDVYCRADPRFSGRVTVPVLWDSQRRTIVSNESAEIIRMLGHAFDGLGARPGDYYPEALRAEIDALNSRIYDTVNNGVYKAGFATSQEAYEEGVFPLFETLDWLEERLTTRAFLCGDLVTEADWRLFTTLIRFDSVYVGHFKCNLRRLADYPELWDYTRALYQAPAVAATVNFQHIKGHYYQSHDMINPTGVVPAGPILELGSPTRRHVPV